MHTAITTALDWHLVLKMTTPYIGLIHFLARTAIQYGILYLRVKDRFQRSLSKSTLQVAHNLEHHELELYEVFHIHNAPTLLVVMHLCSIYIKDLYNKVILTALYRSNTLFSPNLHSILHNIASYFML